MSKNDRDNLVGFMFPSGKRIHLAKKVAGYYRTLCGMSSIYYTTVSHKSADCKICLKLSKALS